MSDRNTVSKRTLNKKRRSARKESIFSKYLPVWVFAGVFIVIAAIVGALVLTPSSQTDPLDKSVGPSDAKVVVTEVGDFQCPACKSFALDIAPKIKADFADKGLIRFSFRQMAFIGQESILAAEASECANEQGKFWEYYELLYQNQAGENVGAITNASLGGFAQQLNLDMNQFNSCLSSHKYRAKVQRETNEGQSKGVYQTPSVLINDRLADWGGDYSKLQDLINQAIQNTQ
jgi:protein-disulfide isomerase